MLKIEPPELPGLSTVKTFTGNSQSPLAQFLQIRSGLSFTTVLTADYFTHLYALLHSAQEEDAAHKLIADFDYGRIRTTSSGQRMLFFANNNSKEHCEAFRAAVASLL